MLKDFEILDLGLVDFDEAFSIQNEVLEKRQKNEIGDSLIFCSHPSVVTLGRGSEDSDLESWSGEVKSINRGGRATYHGPGQVVCYPIISLKENSNLNFSEQDVRAYLESLEGVLIKALADFGFEAKAVSGRELKPGQLNRGVWVQNKKIASIGIAVKKWVTQHGFALNLKKDPLAFSGIKACGFNTEDYTSIEDLGVEASYEDLVKACTKHFKS